MSTAARSVALTPASSSTTLTGPDAEASAILSAPSRPPHPITCYCQRCRPIHSRGHESKTRDLLANLSDADLTRLHDVQIIRLRDVACRLARLNDELAFIHRKTDDIDSMLSEIALEHDVRDGARAADRRAALEEKKETVTNDRVLL